MNPNENSNNTYDNGFVTIGAYLRHERESRGLSLKIISQHTKISATMLQNLEDENFELLPNEAYIKGFVKSVSKTLGLPEEYALEILHRTIHTENQPAKNTPAPEKTSSNEEDTSSESEPVFKMGLVALGALVIIGFLVVINTSGKKDIAEVEVTPTPTLDIEKTNTVTPKTLTADTPLRKENLIAADLEQTTESTPVATPEVTATSTPEPTATEVATPTPTPVPTATATPEPTKVAEKKKEEKTEEEKEIEFKKFTRPLYGFMGEGAKEELNKYVPKLYQSSVVKDKQNVFIKAISGDTWLTYKSDNEPIKKFILKKGRHLIIRGYEIIAFLGNVKVTKIFLNNKPLVINSRSGVKSLVFPQNKKDKYHLPLFIYDKKKGSVMTSLEFLENKKEE
ncbi:MAG: helix-turn-helix domain-containing protein [Bacteriovoracaceae bacterium]|nr:helix-turn-helix domain-containing protein [Bacteriovoracaceae bacterium]